MRNKILKIATALVLSICFMYANAQNTMFVKEKTGVQTPNAIADIKKLTFAAGNMIVSKENGNTTAYAIANLRFLNFGNNTYTIIPKVGIEGSSTIKLYPNPVFDQLHIQYESVIPEDIQLKITDLQGRLMLHQALSSQYGTNDIAIPVEKLPKGLYICILRIGNKLETNRFIKQ